MHRIARYNFEYHYAKGPHIDAPLGRDLIQHIRSLYRMSRILVNIIEMINDLRRQMVHSIGR